MSEVSGSVVVAGAWLRLAEEVDQLDDEGMGAVVYLLRSTRASLPPELVALVGVLDASRALLVAVTAVRKGLSVEEVERVIGDALAGGSNG